MIKNIIFDMGNVLLRFDPQIPLDLYCRTEEEKTVIQRELFEGPEWIQGDLGAITNEQKYDSIKKRIPEDMHPSLKKCVYEWDICMKPLPNAYEFCEYVKAAGYKLYVLSNASAEFYDYFPRFAPLDYFNGVVVSSDIHKIKPDIQIYRHLLEAYHLLPEECLFIDDMEANIKGAKEAGIQGAIFRGDFEEIKRQYDL